MEASLNSDDIVLIVEITFEQCAAFDLRPQERFYRLKLRAMTIMKTSQPTAYRHCPLAR